ncbi:hypothetical protein HD596_001792 [Nonomuraea jabiensis]|uniref:Mutator family transposase n=1 Tax=Nonomuraea jabiensis TaxID=882448 RepID=A0A7W9G0Q8_9ACTN|nr:hypothetical protein [Nonomuraea jabiensis]
MSSVIQASTEIDLEDAEVARKQPKASKAKDSDRELVARLVAQARAEGVELVGENGLLGRLTKLVLESALEGEITDHLGYDKHERGGSETGNSRNGARSKTVITDVGPVEISVPRDRDGSFEPKIVRKRQRRLSGVDEMVISLAAKGLTTGEISAHLAEVYGAEVSRQTISTITDKVLEGMAEWRNRPLDPVYPVLFIDAIHVKLREGQVANRPIYVAMAVTMDGERDILGLWAGDGGEGAKFWLHVLTEIKNRGVGDALMVSATASRGCRRPSRASGPKRSFKRVSCIGVVRKQHGASWFPVRWGGMAIPDEVRDQLALRFAVLLPHLNERQRRLALATEARLLGHGGVRLVARVTGVSESTVRKGVFELEAGVEPLPDGRVRRSGGGRLRAEVVDRLLLPALMGLVEPDERGDPESPLRWTTKSLRHLADELTRQGHRVTAPTVGRLLKENGFSLQGTAKVLEGDQHPDRDAQFRYQRTGQGPSGGGRAGGQCGCEEEGAGGVAADGQAGMAVSR